MIFAEETYLLDRKQITLRSARPDEAQMLVDYLKTVSGETRFLRNEPDEITFTPEEEEQFIRSKNEAKDALMMLAFVDGEYAGNCSFGSKSARRREKHRADIGIALFQNYTGFGLGRLMLNRLLEMVKEQGFEQAELEVVSNNHRARRLYESLGFRECGRIPNAYHYPDGTCADNILMVLQF